MKRKEGGGGGGGEELSTPRVLTIPPKIVYKKYLILFTFSFVNEYCLVLYKWNRMQDCTRH